MFFCFYYLFLIKNNRIGRRRERICKKKKSKKYITNILGVEPLLFAFAPGNRLCEHAVRARASSEVQEWCRGENEGGERLGVGVCTKGPNYKH